MTRATIHVTDTPDGRVRVDLETERNFRGLPLEKCTAAERCANGIYRELSQLALHVPELSTHIADQEKPRD